MTINISYYGNTQILRLIDMSTNDLSMMSMIFTYWNWSQFTSKDVCFSWFIKV